MVNIIIISALIISLSGDTNPHSGAAFQLKPSMPGRTGALMAEVIFSPLPDLRVSYFWWKSEEVATGDGFWIRMKVTNAGEDIAGPCHIQALLSPYNDWDITDDTDLGKQYIDSINPGNSDTIQWNFSFPDMGPGNPSAWIIGIVDCDYEVTESDENNTWKCNSPLNIYDPPDVQINTGNVYMFEIGDMQAAGTFSMIDSAESDSVDWSLYDSPVKNQAVQSCGACWAFAATALIENLSGHPDLSEQAIISCADSGDCSGGWTGMAFKYFRENGVPPENCYPYIGENGECTDKCAYPEYLVKVRNYDFQPRWNDPSINTVNDLKSLLQDGPVVVSMDLPNDPSLIDFQAYNGGIYNYQGDYILNPYGHAVLVVGYNDSGQYFRVKNSWGPDWGENGYFRITYDDVTDDIHFGGYACTASGVYTKREGDEFILTNAGGGTLEISDIAASKSWLSFNTSSPHSMNLTSRDSVTIDCVVDWNLVPWPSDKATVTVYSNDPDEPAIELFVTATPVYTSISEKAMNDEIQVYPNPAHDVIHVKLAGNVQIEKIELFDFTGKIIRTLDDIHTNVVSVDSRNLTPGIYFIRIQSAELYTKKVIIQ